MPDLILSIDAGTTGVSVFLFDHKAHVVRRVYSEFAQYYPQPGWIEHDPEEIWSVVQRLVNEVAQGLDASRVAALGITNQRETTVLWHRKSGKPVGNAIVWQCRRTTPICNALKKAGHTERIKQKTGLVMDPYFSATKIQWLLDRDSSLRQAARNGELAFGTVDTWLLWKLTGGRMHATDFTNASRTLLYNIHEKKWDEELTGIFGVPQALLPEVRSSTGHFGETDASLLGRPIPIRGIAGDQQAALFGQAGFGKGDAKNTYGTGCFMLVNTGSVPVTSEHGLLTTLACGPKGEAVYAVEGAVFAAGSAVQWLRDGLGIINSAQETAQLAESVPDAGGVTVVPAFAGLGAPYWDSAARGAIQGISRSTRREHIVRATLESIAQQTADLLDAITEDLDIPISELRVDGKACANDFLMQFQADLLGIPVDRPKNIDTTALGAALLAGLGCGFWHDIGALNDLRTEDLIFTPSMDDNRRKTLRDEWHHAVERILTQN